MINFGWLNGETFGVFFGELDNIIVVNCCPLKLPFIFLAMCHKKPPLDLNAGVGDRKVLILELVKVFFQNRELIFVHEPDTVVELVLNCVH
jgi:hypothetical protein